MRARTRARGLHAFARLEERSACVSGQRSTCVCVRVRVRVCVRVCVGRDRVCVDIEETKRRELFPLPVWLTMDDGGRAQMLRSLGCHPRCTRG